MKKKKSLCLVNKILKKYEVVFVMGVINVMNFLKFILYINIYWILYNILGIL